MAYGEPHVRPDQSESAAAQPARTYVQCDEGKKVLVSVKEKKWKKGKEEKRITGSNYWCFV